jgi:hypothetical protein
MVQGSTTTQVAATNNYSATSYPITSNDSSQGYSIGSCWINTTSQNEFICVSASVGAAVWKSTTGGSFLTSTQHAALRQLIHFIDGGPAEQFATKAYRENTGTVFPTAIIWYTSSAKTNKIVEKDITWTGAFPTTVAWKMYDASNNLLVTVTDAIVYSGPFETYRTRTIV